MKDTNDSSPRYRDTTGKGVGIIRGVIIVCALILLVVLCLQTSHAGLKGPPTEPWRLVTIILLATTAATIGKRFFNSVSGIVLGGIGGALGSEPPLGGPYGGIVGLVVGAIVVLLPFFPSRQILRRDKRAITGTLPKR